MILMRNHKFHPFVCNSEIFRTFARIYMMIFCIIMVW